MKIEVGKEYINKTGEFIRIVSIDPNKDKNGNTIYIDNASRSYFEDGRYFYGYRTFDIIGEVK